MSREMAQLEEELKYIDSVWEDYSNANEPESDYSKISASDYSHKSDKSDISYPRCKEYKRNANRKRQHEIHKGSYGVARVYRSVR